MSKQVKVTRTNVKTTKMGIGIYDDLEACTIIIPSGWIDKWHKIYEDAYGDYSHKLVTTDSLVSEYGQDFVDKLKTDK